MKAIGVKALEGYKIEVVYTDGVTGTVDLNDLVQKGIFQQLKTGSAFQNVHTDGSAIIWSDELEIDAENIYAEILNLKPENLLHTPLYHAAD